MTPRVTFILWSIWKQHWPEIERRARERFDMPHGHTTISMPTEAAMRALIMDIYAGSPADALDPGKRRKFFHKLTEKAAVLWRFGDSCRVLTGEWRGEGSPWAAAEAFKDGLRAELPKVKGVTEVKGLKLNMHCTSNEDEARFLPAVLFDERNLRYVAERTGPPREELVSRIDTLRQWCARNRIDRNRVCVISGSVLEACELRLSNDLDIIAWDELRALPPLPDGVDIATKQYHPELTNNEVILHHTFTMLGVKFATLPVVLEAKLSRSRAKDAGDRALARDARVVGLLRRLAP